MKKNHIGELFAAPVLMLSLAMPGFANTTSPAATPPAVVLPTCKDGTTSTVAGKGACSHHGGVAKATKMTATPTASPAAAMPASAAPAAAAPAPAAKAAAPSMAASSADPTGATAKCKDGTYSHAKSHSGACSKHGGVADWLTAAK
jgi:hypothetical protein